MSVLLAEIRFTGGYDTVRVGSDWWYSRASDSIGVREWQGRLVSEPTYSVALGCVTWASRTSASIGNLEIADPDNELQLESVEARDSICELRIAEAGQGYDETTIVGRVIVDSVERDGAVWRVALRGIDSLLDRPMQDTVFEAAPMSSSTGTSTSEGFVDGGRPPDFNASGNPTIEGDKVPVVYGRVWQQEPVLLDETSLIHQITDCGIVEITEVYSGGSIANPPDSSQEDWDYALARSGFRFFTQPTARVTCNVNGIRALGLPLVLTRFGSESLTSDGWTTTAGTGASVATVADVGVRLTTSNGEASLSFDTGTSGDEWIVVLLEVADITEGYLRLTANQTYDIKRPGRHGIITTIGSSPSIKIEAVREGTADCTVAVAAIYPLDPAQGTTGLVEMVRHIVVARAAIPDADADEVTVLSLDVGDFDFETSGVATAADAGSYFQLDAGDTSTPSLARAFWGTYLTAGVEYSYSISIEVTSYTGDVIGGEGLAGVRVYLRDAYANESTLYELKRAGSATISGTIQGTTDVQLWIDAEAPDQYALQARVTAVSVTSVTFVDQGQTVDLISLAQIDAGRTFGLVAERSETVRDTITRALDSIAGWMYPDPSGRLRFGQLREPNGIPILTLDETNIIGLPARAPDLAPGLSDTWAGARNWSPYTDSELAGITYPNRPPFRAEYREKRRPTEVERYARPYTHAMGAEQIETYLYDGTELEIEASRVAGLYREQRAIWTVDVALESATNANLIRCDQLVLLDDARFGNENGRLAIIVGVSGRYRSNVLQLTIWT